MNDYNATLTQLLKYINVHTVYLRSIIGDFRIELPACSALSET